ncbi:MAG: hypothetical protein HRT76_08150, partial [Halieaceae bacterium]|nr:hypothetical protein [Halieaceae bacterium]
MSALIYSSPVTSRWLLLCLGTVLLLVCTAAMADSREAIDSKSAQALERLLAHNASAEGLLGKAKGVLVFPDVVKMGFG